MSCHFRKIATVSHFRLVYFKDTLNEVQKIQKLQHYRSERDIVYKNRRNNKRKQNKSRNKEYRNKNIRNKLSKKSRNPKMQYRQRIAFKGENCQFVDFGLVGSEGSGCVDGTKMVLQNK